MSDWQTRLQPTISFFSPLGNQFAAQWRGNERTVEKMIGEYSFPGRDGSVLQDLGSRGVKYPLTIYFEGPNHDIFAAAFFEAMRERGPWMVEHPVYSFIELQPLSATEIAAPVESANITEIETEWLEPLDEETLETARQQWGIIDQLAIDVRAASGQSYADQVVTEEEG